MRLLTLLFSFYITCLSCLPCMDEAVGCVEQVGQTTVAAHSDLDGASRADWCSPLCQCHCCAGVVAPAAPAPLWTAAPAPAWNVGPHRARLVKQAPTRMPGGVWQPPWV
ncbi:hypothetical protein J7E24_09280 [Hymenobacter sp. ISL-91]|uniref:DUF6660 family protein n=1 Tax=Hymenobacter TaxID=89966 RepID=UPI001BEC1B4B|nr:DUF6660 family protein [Hymenobacter sp. ISL-91]MBT2557975.1 hypothetical protein [Hymenobacter sp. ISL-91]